MPRENIEEFYLNKDQASRLGLRGHFVVDRIGDTLKAECERIHIYILDEQAWANVESPVNNLRRSVLVSPLFQVCHNVEVVTFNTDGGQQITKLS